jgi:uncharacterized membrane protein
VTEPKLPDTESVHPADHERWFAAIGYIFFLCFFSLWKGKDSDFVRFHGRQGFALFIGECAAFLAVIIIDHTIGRLQYLGFLIVILVQLAVYIAALFLAVTGFVKALFGERWEMPFFGPHAEKLPML